MTTVELLPHSTHYAIALAMNKDFPKHILQEMVTEKKLKTLYDLARHIESEVEEVSSKNFNKLRKYHDFLKDDQDEFIQKINKEFYKIKSNDYQFQVYLMNLERFLGQSTKEYQFLVNTKDELLVTKKSQIVCLADSVRSAHNIGAFFRNAECFGVKEIILSGLSPSGDHHQVKKTAMGCDEFVSWSYIKNPLDIIKKYKELNYKIIAIETGHNAISLNQLQIENDKILLLFGHEQFGISLELLKQTDEIVKIDLHGQKNSLNVSVSQAVALNHINYLLEKA